VTSEALLSVVGIYAGTFAVGAVSSLLPFVSIEVFLVALTIARGPADALILVVLATAGQVIGKLPVYAATRAASSLPGRQRRWVERIRGWAERRGHRPVALLGISALVGLPPFSLASTAAGVLAIRLRTFCVVIAAGRAARFVILIAIAARFAQR
jgi:membrane protein YqaA with SNARE-associated domain